MTNLLDTQRFPATGFGDLYHQRWRIETGVGKIEAASDQSGTVATILIAIT